MNKFRQLTITLITFALWHSAALASFQENSRRYLSPKDMFTLLAQKFPVLSEPAKVEKLAPGCWTLGKDNQIQSGLVVPSLGLPAITRPSPGFVRWWAACGEKIVALQFQELANRPADEKLWRRFWDQAVLDKYRDSSQPATPFHNLESMQWSRLRIGLKDTQTRFLVTEWIGPNPVIKDLGFSKGTDDLVEIIKSAVDTTADPNLVKANQQLILALLMREEFLTY